MSNSAVLAKRLGAALQGYFLQFLTTFKPDDSPEDADPLYVSQALEMKTEQKTVLLVSIQHIKNQKESQCDGYYPHDLVDIIVNQYLEMKPYLDATVPQFLQRIPESGMDIFAASHRFTVTFYEIYQDFTVRDMICAKLGCLCTLSGTVTKVSEVKPELLVGTFECMRCGHEISGVKQQFKRTDPVQCPAGCGNRSDFTLRPNAPTTRFGDWQKLRIQENANEIPAGSMPRSLDVIVRDSVCETCKAGDKVKMTGCLIVVPDVATMMKPSDIKGEVSRDLNRRFKQGHVEGVKGLKGMGAKELNYKAMFHATLIDQDHRQRSTGDVQDVCAEDTNDQQVAVTPQQHEKVMSILQSTDAEGFQNVFDNLAKSIAPHISGHLDVKKGILLMLLGGVQKRTEDGIKLRGDINVCIVGDPSTAKSQFLKYVSKLVPRGVFCNGKSSSAAGLTASITRDRDAGGENVIEPGALMLADNGVCCIDEFEKMSPTDMAAIHEGMEQQTITLSKAGMQATLNARTSILAACSPIGCYYNESKTLQQNLTLSPPIMSRFDLFFVMVDRSNPVQDREIADFLLTLHAKREYAEEPPVSFDDLKLYLTIARKLRPMIGEDARRMLVRGYKRLRQHGSNVASSQHVTVRQLESLIRLSEAVARVHLDDRVQGKYVKMAFELMISSMRKIHGQTISLDMDEEEEAAEEAADNAEGQPAAKPQRKTTRLDYVEYQKISNMLALYLQEMEEKDKEVTEDMLIQWYLEQFEDNMESEEQFWAQQNMIILIIKRLIERDSIILEIRESPDPKKPRDRLLIKHPNYVIR